MLSRKHQSITIQVPDDPESMRLDKYLGDHSQADISRTKAEKLIRDGLITVDGEAVPTKHKLSGGELIEVKIPATTPTTVVAEAIPLDIVFEDEHLAVVNKPAGMVTHPAVGNYRGTLVNALVHHFGELAGQSGSDRPGIVHRLDKNTSGLLVVARDDRVYARLQSAIQSRQLKRSYLALVCGHLKQEQGKIEFPVGRSSRNRQKMAVVSNGRPAATEYRVVDRFRSYQLLEVSLLTGRTHQIRVHFSHLGHPVLGDPEYGGREKFRRSMFGPERPLAGRLLELIDHQTLHAARLEFEHPMTEQQMKFEVEPPSDFQSVLRLLKSEGY